MLLVATFTKLINKKKIGRGVQLPFLNLLNGNLNYKITIVIYLRHILYIIYSSLDILQTEFTDTAKSNKIHIKIFRHDTEGKTQSTIK